MSVTVIPMQEHEWRHCAYCRTRLQPNGGGRTHVMLGTGMVKDTPELQLEAFSTNRRVIRIKRHWNDRYDNSGNVVERKHHVGRIDIILWPEDDADWGYDGIFCKMTCAWRFAHACYKAGYRIKAPA